MQNHPGNTPTNEGQELDIEVSGVTDRGEELDIEVKGIGEPPNWQSCTSTAAAIDLSTRPGASDSKPSSVPTAKPVRKLAIGTPTKAGLGHKPSIPADSSTSHQPSTNHTKAGLRNRQVNQTRPTNSVPQSKAERLSHQQNPEQAAPSATQSTSTNTGTVTTRTSKAGLRIGLAVSTPAVKGTTQVPYEPYWEEENMNNGSIPAIPFPVPLCLRNSNPPVAPEDSVPGAHSVEQVGGSNREVAAQPHTESLAQALEELQLTLTPPSTSALIEINLPSNLNDKPNLYTVNNSSSAGLAVASAIDDGNHADLPHAVEVDQEELEHRRITERNNNQKFLRTGFLMVVLVLAVIFTTAFILSSKSNGTIQLPSMSPTVPPSESTSSASSTSLDLLFQALPNSTLESLKIYGTPQWHAREWLLGHPELPVMPEWRKKQLFALSTFFYAMEGPNWPTYLRDSWLQYSDECLWVTNQDGGFYYGNLTWIAAYWNHNISCSDDGRFRFLHLFDLGLASFHPVIPPEIALLTSLYYVILSSNNINAKCTNFLPTEMCQLKNLNDLDLSYNGLSGSLPTELGCMTSLESLHLTDNSFTGPMPSELGMMTNLKILMLFNNNWTGQIPSQFGLMANILALALDSNQLTGLIPSEISMMSNMISLSLVNNSLSGEIPSEIGQMPNLTTLYLGSNNLIGTIPTEIGWLAMTGTLYEAVFESNSLTGTFPDGLCSLGINNKFFTGVSFDCNDQLCGCCWCPCQDSNTSVDCPNTPFYSTKFFEDDWPGAFPTPLNIMNVVTVNIYTDGFPEETTLIWSLLNGDGTWEVLASYHPQNATALHSYTMQVESNSTYRLQVLDSYGDGICCRSGYGWLTINNSTPSDDHADGTVVLESAGEFFRNKWEATNFPSWNGIEHDELLAKR